MPVLPRREDTHHRRGHRRGAADGDRPRARRLNRRAAALALVLFALYASTIGLRAFSGSEYTGAEAHYLLTAKSLVEDGNPDLRDEYAAHAYRGFYPYGLAPGAQPTTGRLNEPQGVGFPLLIAPAFAIAGAKAVEVFLAALAALAVTLAYLVALRVVPDPWALGATAAIGLSPPLLAYSTAVYPDLAAAAALCGAVLLALRIAARPSRPEAWACFLLLGALPWLGPIYVLPGLVVGAYAFVKLRRARRRVLALACAEIAGFSAALYVGINEGLFGGATPYSADLAGHGATGAHTAAGYVDRSYRLVALFIDREYGLLRWAPILLLVFSGAWLVIRERRSGLVRLIPGLRAEESAAALCGAAALVQLLAAAFLAPTMFGFWFPSRYLVAVLPLCVPLVAVGWRHAPRLGAVLALIGVLCSVWLWVDVRASGGGLVVGRPDAPFGPLKVVLPLFTKSATYPYVLAGLIGVAAVAALVLTDRRYARAVVERLR